MRLSKIILLAFLLCLTRTAHLGKTAEGFEIFSIDLNLEPYDRFRETATFFKEPFLKVLDCYKDVLDVSLILIFRFLDMITFSNDEKYQEI